MEKPKVKLKDFASADLATVERRLGLSAEVFGVQGLEVRLNNPERGTRNSQAGIAAMRSILLG